jgi:hypothetical protein
VPMQHAQNRSPFGLSGRPALRRRCPTSILPACLKLPADERTTIACAAVNADIPNSHVRKSGMCKIIGVSEPRWGALLA